MFGDVPVYKHDEAERYLYRNESGNWAVSNIAGDSCAFLIQLEGNYAPSPPKTSPWQYWDNGFQDDMALRVYPCY